ncbi:cyanophycinase [Pontibacter vulgaris]|uniref:cyanophycinase n=1 Tax=Pontibacter vulgaris TaxID=2905679 RepID=UPI001FA818FB|nr:cyanophycinase [Pontibacter vulgaris]
MHTIVIILSLYFLYFVKGRIPTLGFMQVPKGKIVAIGGHEDKGSVPMPADENLRASIRFFEHGILKRIHDELYGLGTRIEVITTASHIPEEMGKAYVDAFLLLGCENVGVMHIQNATDANRHENLKRLQEANAVMFTGGDQKRIADAFMGSEALTLLKNRYLYEEKFLVSGTSAGAMALSAIMIEGAKELNPLVKGTVRIGEGMGLIQQIIIDTHFVNRRRIPRLTEAIAANPTHIGIGLGEDTGILITQGNIIETIGSALVIIIDGRKLTLNNYEEIAPDEAICLENLIMHVLPRGKAYLLNKGKFLTTELEPTTS